MLFLCRNGAICLLVTFLLRWLCAFWALFEQSNIAQFLIFLFSQPVVGCLLGTFDIMQDAFWSLSLQPVVRQFMSLSLFCGFFVIHRNNYYKMTYEDSLNQWLSALWVHFPFCEICSLYMREYRNIPFDQFLSFGG